MDTDTKLSKTRALIDEKSLKKVTSQFYKLVNCNLTGDELLGNHELLNSQIQQFKSSTHRGIRLLNLTELEITDYQLQVSLLKQAHSETLETLKVLKLKLERAIQERCNKIEYNLLAKKITKLPDRQTAQETNSGLSLDISGLNRLSLKYHGTWSIRFNDFNSIINSLTTLTESIKLEKLEQQRRLLLEEGETFQDVEMKSSEPIEEKEEGEE